jgi:3-methyladenine DNA glycosylase AlkC
VSVCHELESTSAESVNLMEQIALDLDALIAHQLPEIAGGGLGAMALKTRMTTAGRQLAEVHSPEALFERVSALGDTARAIAALGLGHLALDPASRLALLRPFADDRHFGVREWAWIGLRDSLGDELLSLVPALQTWTAEDSPRVRRFASEITRPRGVWCRHWKAVRREPEICQGILDPLAIDPDRYVQASVGNWLNDAARDRPDWVRATVGRWVQASSEPAHTHRIVRRASARLARAGT